MFSKLIILIVWSGLVCTSLFAQQLPVQQNNSSNRSDLIKSKVSDLKSPIYAEALNAYRDGGTISVALKDADGKFFLFCLDGRGRTPGHVYVGVEYPTDPPEKGWGFKDELPIGGE